MCHLYFDCRKLHSLSSNRSWPRKALVRVLVGLYLGVLSMWCHGGSLFPNLETQGFILIGNVSGHGMVMYSVLARIGRDIAATSHEFARARWRWIYVWSSILCTKPQLGSYHISPLCLVGKHLSLVGHLLVSAINRTECIFVRVPKLEELTI